MPIPFEPFRIKSVEPIRTTTPAQRRQILQQVEHNLFKIPADQVMIDLITDSGTGAMSSRQWAGMMRGDESYAGSASHARLVEVCQRLLGFTNVLPTHQGRASEQLLVRAVIGEAPRGKGRIVPNNAHFDTTRRMIEASGAEARNLLAEGGDDPNRQTPFKGDIDLRALEQLLRQRADDVPFVVLTITCNSNGGQPVSLDNVRATRAVCDRFGKMLILDACRFAENAWFIKARERRQSERPLAAIVRDTFDLADGVVMSTRKDGLCNTGGLLMLRDDALFQRACSLCVLTEGFTMTYGGLPGRDLEAIAIGLQEAMEEAYLASRVSAIQQLADRLLEAGVPIVQPAGGHAIYIDAEAFCAHLDRADQPAHALACALYVHGGIRASRIGSALRVAGQPMELVRLAIPRRTYTHGHLDYVARIIIELMTQPERIESRPATPHIVVPREQPEFETV